MPIFIKDTLLLLFLLLIIIDQRKTNGRHRYS